MNFANLRVKTKLMLAFALLAGAVLLVAAPLLHSRGGSIDRFASYLWGVCSRERLARAIHGAASARAIAARNRVLATESKDVELEKAAVLKAELAARFKTADLHTAAFA